MALRAAAAVSGDPLLGWNERVVVAGRAAVARETIVSSPLYSFARWEERVAAE
jgi:hypothetical protein